MHREDGGFTLIELLVVIIIIGILAVIAVPSYLSLRGSANQSAAQANVRAAIPVVQGFFADNNTYVGMDTAALVARDNSLDGKVIVDAAPAVSANNAKVVEAACA